MELEGISSKSPSQVLEKLGHILLDSSRALSENRSKREGKAEEKASHSRSQPPKRKRHNPTRPKEACDADCIDLELSDTDPDDLLERADVLQKSMKSTCRGKSNDDSIFLAVCAMKEGKPGVYTRAKGSSFIEITARRKDDYVTFCKKAAKACKLVEKGSRELCLFKMNGAQIPNAPMKTATAGKQKGWTLGTYLSAVKRAPANVKIGIGYIKSHAYEEEPIMQEPSSSTRTSRSNELIEDSDNKHHSNIRVMYYIPPRSSTREFSVRGGLTRAYIWECIKGCDPARIGQYHPEDDGYIVFSVHKDDRPILTHGEGGTFSVQNSNNDFEITCQSPKSISISSTMTAMLIYCIASCHGKCRYVWHKFGQSTQEYPSTPIIYVNQAGMYQCTIKMGSKSMKGNIITIKVTVNADSDTNTTSITQLSPPFKRMKHNINLWDAAGDFGASVDIDNRPILAKEDEDLISQLHHHTVRTEVQNCQLEVDENLIGYQSQQTDDNREDQQGHQQTEPPKEHQQDHQQTEPAKEHQQDHQQTKTTRQLQQVKTTQHQPQVREFSVDDIKAATGNLSTLNILGRGGFGIVYQGYYKGTKVAIKKFTENASLNFSQFEGKEVPHKFTVTGQLNCEMWALTRCRHKNLVDLMGFCANPPFLVYELLEEGNLYDRLHKKTPVLTIHQRSRILKDVCRGLSWLHSMEPPIMHGDVKTRNILLDKDFTAKLGDFGFTQEIPCIVGERSMITAAMVAKSLGYSPPEMDTAHISCKSDMYCYGVVALETFTRKPPYCKVWEDPKLVEHFDDQRKTTEGYKTIYDQSAGPIPHYLLLIYYKLIENCLLKHSRRCTSTQAMEWWSETNY